MHYPDSRWRPRCQGKSRDDVFGRITVILFCNYIKLKMYLVSQHSTDEKQRYSIDIIVAT